MNARSAILVAVVAGLLGGAIWLARGIDKRSQPGAVTPDPATPESGALAQSVLESQLAPASRSIESERAQIGERQTEAAAMQAANSPWRVHALVLRAVPKARPLPVPRARVQIVDTALVDGRPGWTVLAEGDTNANGEFSFDAPQRFHATVRAEATIDGKRMFGVTDGFAVQSNANRFQVLLVDEPRTETRITVIDRDTLQPIPGADVRPQNGAEPTTTNGLGEFVVSITNGSLSAWVGGTGYFPVVWSSSDPNPGVTPRLWQEAQQKLFEAEGKIRAFRRGDARRLESAPVEVEPLPKAPKPSSLFLHRSARMQGSVVDARGRSIAGVRLKTRVHFGDRRYESRDVQVETDDRGRFAFEALPAGITLPFELTSSGETVRADVQSFELAPGETRLVTLRIRGHVELSGRVLDGKDELVKAGHIVVSVDGRTDTGRIRGDGTYYLPFAVAGDGWIEVTREARANEPVEPERVPISIPFNVTEWTCDVRLVPAMSIAGVFLDAENHQVSGELSLWRGSTLVVDPTMSNAMGEFRFDAVPVGEYTLRGSEQVGAKRSVQVQVHAGDQNVLVRLPAQGVVVGRVVDAGGTAVGGARVTIAPGEGPEVSLVCADDGGFRSPAPIGSVWVSAEMGDLQTLLARVSVGAQGESKVPDLVLAPSAPMRFTAGRLAAPAQIEVRSDAGLCFDGSFASYAEQVIRVPLGTVRVTVLCAGKPPELRVIEVRAGETVLVPIAGGT